MKEFKTKREQVEAEFIGFMEQTIWNCARNATRMAYAAELRNSGISLETLSERNYIEYLTSEDKHECEDCYGILNFQIPINSELVNMLLDGLTEREKQALILRVVLDLDYDEIGKKLGIEPNRVRDYKYQGLRKARKKKNGGKK